MSHEYKSINSDYIMRILQKVMKADFEQITVEELIDAYENQFIEMKIIDARIQSLKDMQKFLNKIILMKISQGDIIKQNEWMKLREGMDA